MILEHMGIQVSQINFPSATCTASLPLIKQNGGNFGEPGHGLTGTTPYHSKEHGEEKPAIVYVTEVSHNIGDKAYCYGRGHYRRSRVHHALVGKNYESSKCMKVIPPTDENIDYYFELEEMADTFFGHQEIMGTKPRLPIAEPIKNKIDILYTQLLELGYEVKFHHGTKERLLVVKNALTIANNIECDLGQAFNVIAALYSLRRCGVDTHVQVQTILGINDIAIGTDEGGSVLVPTLSCNLFSVLGKGFGLVAKKDALSTEDIHFQPDIGVIANKRFDLERVLNTVTPMRWIPKEGRLKIVIPEQGNCRLADGEDMHERIMGYLGDLIAEHEVIMYKFEDIYDCIQTLKDTKYIFEVLKADITLPFEGPIDVFGYDETILRSFEGKVAQDITMQGQI